MLKYAKDYDILITSKPSPQNQRKDKTMSTLLNFKKSDYQKIITHCKNALPNEACGLLAGTITHPSNETDSPTPNYKTIPSKLTTKTITKVYLLTNTDNAPNHYSMNPEEQLKAIKDARANDTEIIGCFHSHSHTPAVPSSEDKRLACDSDMEYLILSLQEPDCPVLKAFGITQQEHVEAHKLHIE